MGHPAEILKYGIYLLPVFLMNLLDRSFFVLADAERAFEITVFHEGNFRIFAPFDVRSFFDRSDLVLGELLGFA